ncbi:hypothetical protein P43SY_008795 [Pythium insidiosum]|uniref:Uncharacterized protein n=1 Tax=Pythium insidiosum TaxID=114742 RepID=A0AAD5LNU6_PYTIN|nr:hypothetical protein P43SY_008795 [Pythium insidiosum]
MDELRGSAPVTPRPADKLPQLCARPGNVGVQIDAFRAIKAFHRPRCGQFTERFLGMTYENHSMENHARILERTQRRAQIVADRLRKLEEHEARLVVMEQHRRVRWQQLEAAQQRRVWLMRQAAKRQELRRQEEEAAVNIQRYLRGSVARRVVSLMRRDVREVLAARCLQVFWRRVARAKENARRRQEEDKTRRLQAAQTIQRVTRRRLLSRSLPAVDEAPERPAVDEAAETGVVASPVSLDKDDDEALRAAQSHDELLHPDLSIELLFSATSSNALLETTLQRVAVGRSGEVSPKGISVAPSPRPPAVAVKRVGGGFRTLRSPRATLQPPSPSAAKPSRPNRPQHHQPRQPRPRLPARVGRLMAPAGGYSSHVVSHGRAAAHQATHAAFAAPPGELCELLLQPSTADDDTLLELVQQLDLAEP